MSKWLIFSCARGNNVRNYSDSKLWCRYKFTLLGTFLISFISFRFSLREPSSVASHLWSIQDIRIWNYLIIIVKPFIHIFQFCEIYIHRFTSVQFYFPLKWRIHFEIMLIRIWLLIDTDSLYFSVTWSMVLKTTLVIVCYFFIFLE